MDGDRQRPSLPITPVEECLELLRLGRSRRARCRPTPALHGYFDYLDLVGVARDQIETLSFGGHLRWLRTGLLPSVTAPGPETPALKETSDRLMPETETEMRIGETLALKY